MQGGDAPRFGTATEELSVNSHLLTVFGEAEVRAVPLD
jgi:hypothetical protein